MGKKSRLKSSRLRPKFLDDRPPTASDIRGSQEEERSQQGVPCDAEHLPILSTRGWLLLALLVAAILRLAFLTEVSSSPFAIPQLFDQATYISWAEGIVKGNWEGMNMPYWQGPLYPYMIALIFALSGKSLLAVRIIQILIGLGIVFGIFILTRKLFGERAAIISAFLAAAYRPFIFIESAFLTETVLAFLSCAAVLAIVYAGETQNIHSWFLAGFAVGIAALGRGSALVLFPLALIWLIRLRTHRGSLRRSNGTSLASTARAAADPPPAGPARMLVLALCIGLVLPIIPVTTRNILTSHQFVLLSANSGLNLFIGNHTGANGTYDLPQGLDTQSDPRGEAYALSLAHRQITSSELSTFYTSRVKEFIKKTPGMFISLFFKKVLLFIHSAEISHDDDFDYFRRASIVMKLPLLSYGILLPLAGTGAILAFIRKRGMPELMLLSLALLLTVLFTVIFFVALRYRIPSVPLMIPFAALALSEFWDHVTKRDYRTLFSLLFPFFALFVFCMYPFHSIKELVLLTKLQSHNQTSLAYQQLGEMQKALDELKEAIDLSPENSSLHLNIGNVFLVLGDRGNAEKEYRDAIRLNPSNVNAHSNLGTLLEERHDLQGAEREYMQALAINPNHQASQEKLRRLRNISAQQQESE